MAGIIIAAIIGILIGISSFLGACAIWAGDRTCAYILFVLIAGGFGGFVFSLSDPRSYELHIPFSKNEKLNLGFLGHVLAGMLAGAIGLYFVGQIIDQNLWNLDLVTDGSVKHLFTVFSMASLCGFLGLKLLSRLANKLLDKVIDEVEVLKKGTANLKRETEETAADELASRAKMALIEKRPQDALDYTDKSIKILNTARAWGFKANAWRQLGDLRQAISCINKAISLHDDDPRRMATFYWNRACYKSLLNERVDSIIADLKKSIGFEPTFRDDLLREEDLTNARRDGSFFKEFELVHSN